MENQTLEGTPTETPVETVETTETPIETPVETPEETVKETPEPVDYEVKFKESQKEAIRLKKENDEFRNKPSTPKGEPDIDAIVEINRATNGLSPEEIAELQFRAAANKSSLSEARKDENFVLWQDAHKMKVEKEQTLSPSTKQSATPKKKSLAEMTVKEKEDALLQMGVGQGKASWAQQRVREDSKK